MADTEADEREILDVGALYEQITARLESAFGRRFPRWIRGEVAKVYEKSHLYVDLVDSGSSSSDTRRPVLNVHCWASQWATLKRRLSAEGVTLAPGAVINVFGYVDLYAPQGKIGFTMTDVDVAGLLGDVARRRAELIARLRTEGLIDANRSRPLAEVPLRLGLVASPATEGYRDFTGQLERSGYAFEVTLVRSLVQGDGAPEQIATAIERLDVRGLDAICVVRGGGSRGDLVCFDDERVARAIATAATPVLTGIGHTGDESVADLVAHTRAVTPTHLGEEIVRRVAEWERRHVREPARRLSQGAGALVEEATTYLAERRRTMILAVRDRLRAERRHLDQQRRALGRGARRTLDEAEQRVRTTRQLLAAYDPARRLAQGWAIVTDTTGVVVRSVTGVAVGASLTVRLVDGTLETTVTSVEEES